MAITAMVGEMMIQLLVIVLFAAAVYVWGIGLVEM